jgi:hypothetical protein
METALNVCGIGRMRVCYWQLYATSRHPSFGFSALMNQRNSQRLKSACALPFDNAIESAGFNCPARRAPESRQTGFLKSFGRRRRTKVLEERTRGGQAFGFGDLGFWLMQEVARRSPRHVHRPASFRYRRAVFRFCALQ